MLSETELIDRIRRELRTELAEMRPPRDVARQAWEAAHPLPIIAGTPMPDAVRGSRRWPRPSGAALAAAASVIAAVAIAVGAVALLGHRQRVVATYREGHSHSASVPSDLGRSFAVFDRAATKADALSAAFRAELQTIYGSQRPDVAEARRVTASDGQAAYLVPTRDGACVVNTNEALCAPVASLAGAATADLCSPTLPLGRIELEWLLPDGASDVTLSTADATATHLTPGFNVYITRVAARRPLPSTINWTDPGGHRHTVATPIPPDARRQTCAHPSTALPPTRARRPSATSKTTTGPGVATVVSR